MGTPWQISWLFPVGGGIDGQLQLGAVTGMDTEQLLLVELDIVTVTVDTVIGIPVMVLPDSVPAEVVTTPLEALKVIE